MLSGIVGCLPNMMWYGEYGARSSLAALYANVMHSRCLSRCVPLLVSFPHMHLMLEFTNRRILSQLPLVFGWQADVNWLILLVLAVMLRTGSSAMPEAIFYFAARGSVDP